MRFPQTTKRQGIQGREQGRPHRRVLAEQGLNQISRGTDTANQLTENEQKFSRQREKMWERMRKRKASTPKLCLPKVLSRCEMKIPGERLTGEEQMLLL